MQQETTNDGFDAISFNPSEQTIPATESPKEAPVEQKMDSEKQEQPAATEGNEGIEKAVEQDSEEAGKDQDINFFENFKPEGEEDDPSPEFDIITQAKELGIEAETPEQLLDKLKELTELKEQVPIYPNEESEQYVKRFLELVKSGEDPFTLKEGRQEIAQLEARSTELNSTIEFLEEKLRTADLDERRIFLTNHYKEILGPGNDDAAMQIVENKEDLDVTTEFKSVMKSHLAQSRKELESNGNRVNEIKSSEEKKVEEARLRQEAFQKTALKKISEYTDPDGIASFTKAAQKTAKAAFNTSPMTISIPKGIASMLLLNDEGQVDVSKITSTLATLTQGPAKRKHLESLIKKEEFKQMQGVKPVAQSAPPSNPKEQDEWGGGFNFG